MHTVSQKSIVILILILLLCTGLFAQVATIEYLEGWVDIKRPNGDTVEALIGDALFKDDTVITGDDGTATLTKDDQAEIIISPNSVFSIREIDSGGEKETVMHTALGSIKFKFLRLFGREPKISTPSTVAGVRGTEFTVYAGDEGSALFTVDSGEVIVTSQGVPVVLVEDEGVEVKAGRAPGAKFELKGRPIDYSAWNSEKQQEFSADPIQGLLGIERQMEEYIREVENLKENFQSSLEDIKEGRNEYQKIKQESGDDAATNFYQDNVVPIETEAGALNQNLRYFILSAYSLDRYVLGKQYLNTKAYELTKKISKAEAQEIYSIINRISESFWSAADTYIGAFDI